MTGSTPPTNAGPLPGRRSRTLEVPVYGMTCDGCATTVQRGLSRLEGVDQVEIDLAAATATVTGSIAEAEARERIVSMGYRLAPADTDRSLSPGQLAVLVTTAVLVVAVGLWAFVQVSGAVTGVDAEGVQATFARAPPVAFGLPSSSAWRQRSPPPAWRWHRP